MKKDFYQAATLSVFFLLLASLSMGAMVSSWRSVAYYLIHPTTDSLVRAYRYSSHLGKSWQELLETRYYLERFESLERPRELERLRQQVLQEEKAFGQSLVAESAMIKTIGELDSWKAQTVRIHRRGYGQEGWVSVACASGLEAPSGSPLPVLQFSHQRGTFVLAGRWSPSSSWTHEECLELIPSSQYSVAVRIERTGEMALLKGLGDPDRVLIDYLPRESPIAVGDQIRTSPASSYVPAGLLVGEVIDVKKAGALDLFSRAYARLYMELSEVDHLTVIRQP